MNASVLATETYQKQLRALRSGGFVSFIPNLIQPQWNPIAVQLAGFPINVAFSGLRSGRAGDATPLIVTSVYWFDPSTYIEDTDSRSMKYFAHDPSPFRVELKYSKVDERWEGRKFENDEELIRAYGPELRRFIIQLTLCGLHPCETGKEFVSCEGIGSAGVYVWTVSEKRTEGW